MSKKEFTEKNVVEFSNMSDVELIELLNKGTLSPGKRDTIKALLDYRLKKVLNHLKEVTERSVKASSSYNKILIVLTIILTLLTVLMVV